MSASQEWRRGLRGLLAASVLAVPFAGSGGMPAYAGTEQPPPAPMAAVGSANTNGTALFSSPLAGPMRALRLSTLDLPRPVGTGAGTPAIETLAPAENVGAIAILPPPSVFVASRPVVPPGLSLADDAPNALGALAFDLILELPVITADGADLAATYGALAERLGDALPYGTISVFSGDDHQALGLSQDMPALEDDIAPEDTLDTSALPRETEIGTALPEQGSLVPAAETGSDAIPVDGTSTSSAQDTSRLLHHGPAAAAQPSAVPPLAFRMVD